MNILIRHAKLTKPTKYYKNTLEIESDGHYFIINNKHGESYTGFDDLFKKSEFVFKVLDTFEHMLEGVITEEAEVVIYDIIKDTDINSSSNTLEDDAYVINTNEEKDLMNIKILNSYDIKENEFIILAKDEEN